MRATVELDSLEVVEGTGGVRPLTGGDRQEINTTAHKILTSAGSGAATYQSSGVTVADTGGGAIDGTLTMHGRSQPVRLLLSQPAAGRYRGTTTFAQSAFGIRPYSAFLGALKLRDEVEIEFEVDIDAATQVAPG